MKGSKQGERGVKERERDARLQPVEKRVDEVLAGHEDKKPDLQYREMKKVPCQQSFRAGNARAEPMRKGRAVRSGRCSGWGVNTGAYHGVGVIQGCPHSAHTRISSCRLHRAPAARQPLDPMNTTSCVAPWAKMS